MLTEERFAKILSILESMGSVTVQQLMTELNASDLRFLAASDFFLRLTLGFS